MAAYKKPTTKRPRYVGPLHGPLEGSCIIAPCRKYPELGAVSPMISIQSCNHQPSRGCLKPIPWYVFEQQLPWRPFTGSKYPSTWAVSGPKYCTCISFVGPSTIIYRYLDTQGSFNPTQHMQRNKVEREFSAYLFPEAHRCQCWEDSGRQGRARYGFGDPKQPKQAYGRSGCNHTERVQVHHD